MQTYDIVQCESILRSQAYLRKKDYKAQVDREIRHDLVLTLLMLAIVALSIASFVAAIMWA